MASLLLCFLVLTDVLAGNCNKTLIPYDSLQAAIFSNTWRIDLLRTAEKDWVLRRPHKGEVEVPRSSQVL